MSHTEIRAERLTIYSCQTDRHKHQALYEWLVSLALKQGLAGATALRGKLGFGQYHRLHSENLLTLADQLPIVVQVIDTADKIDQYIDATGDALHGYTYIRETVRWHKPNT